MNKKGVRCNNIGVNKLFLVRKHLKNKRLKNGETSR